MSAYPHTHEICASRNLSKLQIEQNEIAYGVSWRPLLRFDGLVSLTSLTKVRRTVEVLAWVDSKQVVRRLGSEDISNANAKLGVFK